VLDTALQFHAVRAAGTGRWSRRLVRISCSDSVTLQTDLRPREALCRPVRTPYNRRWDQMTPPKKTTDASLGLFHLAAASSGLDKCGIVRVVSSSP
jgi:hypothetical protein